MEFTASIPKKNSERGSVAFRQEPSSIDPPRSPERAPLLGNNAITSHLIELDYPEKSLSSMLRCGESSGFRIMASCNCGNRIIPLKHNCNLRTCPRCAKIRKRKLSRKYLPLLKGIHQNRKYFLYFLTISPKNYTNLEQGLNHIKKSFSRFLRHNYIKKRINAGLYVIETKGTEGNWNIHLHAIIYGRWIDNKIRKEKNSKIVRLFKQSSKREVNIHVTRQNSARFTLNYMLKYISANKDYFKTDLDMAKYIVAIRKKRLISTFGEFYKLKLKIKKPRCFVCNQEIIFTIDYEIILEIEKGRKRPPDLRDWFL